MENIGSQKISQIFFNELTSININQIAKDVRKLGIYSGGYLTKVNDTTVQLSPFACEIGDGTYQVRCETSDTVNITVSTTNIYLVLRWAYTGSNINDYVSFVTTNFAGVLSTDIIVGKCVFVGSTLQTTFDYANRTNPNILDLVLKPEPTSSPSMYLRVRAGKINNGNQNIDVVDQLSPLFTAPPSNSRIDLLQIDSSGTVIVTQGIASASPVAPSYSGKVTLAEITVNSGQTSITSTSIKDVRSPIGAPGDNSVSDYKYSAQTSDHGRWLLCSPGGRNISRSTYGALFAIIGTKFGVGDGSSTFGLPNPAGGKSLLAKDTSDTTFNDLGKSGGEKTHLLTAAESGSPTHYHPTIINTNVGGGSYGEYLSVGSTNDSLIGTNNNSPQDASVAHNNLPPFLVIGNLFISFR